MSNEVVKSEQVESEISIIEQSHKSAILSIHENMQQLINDCLSISVSEDDKQSYDNAVELKRVVKATHIAVEKKRKEVKQPLIDYGKRLDRWVEEIYTPLVNAEKIVKKKMEVYEVKQEKLKQERRLVEEQIQKEELELELRLKNLNTQLEKINSAKNKAELKEIEIYLDGIVISEFGTKSNEAGFILNQLKLTCSMASRLMKDEEEQKPVEAPKMETTPITDNFLEELKEMRSEPVKKVVIENKIQETEEILIRNEEEIIEEVSIPVNESVKESIAIKKASEDDVINIIDHISIDALPFVNNFIIEKTKSILGNVEAFNSLDFSEHNDLIFLEVKKRVGILLNK
jgi:hypothetical protein